MIRKAEVIVRGDLECKLSIYLYSEGKDASIVETALLDLAVWLLPGLQTSKSYSS